MERLTQSQKVAADPDRQVPRETSSPLRAAYHDGVELPAADDRLLRHSAGLLAELAARHGITSVHLGDDPAEVVVTLEADRTYFDLVDFQAEAEGLLRHRLAVTSAGAPGAHRREPLATAPAA